MHASRPARRGFYNALAAARAWVGVACVPLALLAGPAMGAADTGHYPVDALNEGLPAPADPVNRMTPRATVEHFLGAVGEGRLERAAHALNLNLLPPAQQAERGPELARQLDELLERHLVLDWGALPDRRDGADRGAATGQNGAGARRSLLLGHIDLGERPTPIRLQRVKAPGSAPVWVFSAQTVDNVPRLHRQLQPGPLQELLPRWASQTLLETPLWEWFALLVLFAGAAVAAVLLRWTAAGVLRHSGLPQASAIARALATPFAVLGGALLYAALTGLLVTPEGTAGQAADLFILALTTAATIWLLVRAIYLVADTFIDGYDARLARAETQGPPLKTYISVAKRVLAFLVILLGAAIGLSQVSGFEAAGLSILASTGAVGIVAGIAAQGFLANIIAGMQIAASKPIVIGDNVVFDGEWGHVEDITYTYVVLRTWDLKRLIIPLRRLLDQPFHNFTKRDSALVMPVYLHVDYTTDVAALRRTYEEMLRADGDYDGTVEPYLLVTGLTENTMEVRAVCSAADPARAFFLHCRLRERLIAHLQGLHEGRMLPRHRVAVEDDGRASQPTGGKGFDRPAMGGPNEQAADAEEA